MTSILMIIAQKDFRDEEFLEPNSIFNKEGFKVDIASEKVGKCYGKLGAVVNSTICIKDVNIDNYNAIVFIGGMGSLDYENDLKVHNLIINAIRKNKILGSICISPRILIQAGVLKGRKFTMWNEDGSQNSFIEKSGGNYTSNPIEVDSNIVTANGPESAIKFAEKISEMIKITG